MFISKQQGRLSLIRHDRHMAQTAALAAAWDSAWFDDSSEQQSLVTAMALHDAGWTAADDAVLFDSERKQPLNFMFVDLARHVDFYRDGYQSAAEAGAASGVLVGMHWIGLYTSRFGLEPGFVYRLNDDQRTLRDETVLTVQQDWVRLKETIWTPDVRRADFEERFWRQYEVFQLLDRLSITLCMNDLGVPAEYAIGDYRPRGATEPVAPRIEFVGDGRVIVDPFPFAEEFAAPIARRWIDDKRYDTQPEAAQAVNSAVDEQLDIRLVAR